MITGTGETSAAGTTATDSGTAAASAPTIANTDFNSSLGEDLRGNESLYGFENVDGLASSYLEQSTQMEAMKAQLDEVSAKVPVVPASVDQYEVNLPEGYNADDEMLNSFKEMAMTEGLSSKQVQAVMDFDSKRIADATAAQTAMNAQVEADFKKEWGADYDANLAIANRAIVQFGGEEFSKALRDAGLAYNPGLIRGFLKAGKAMAEDAMHTSGTMTQSQQRPEGLDGKPMLKFNM